MSGSSNNVIEASSVLTDEKKISLIEEMQKMADSNNWEGAKSILNAFPDIVRIPPLFSGDDRILPYAVSNNRSSIDFVRKLVNYMTPQDLEIQNFYGETALFIAASCGKHEFVQIMLEKNHNLPLIRTKGDWLPVHGAAAANDPRNLQVLRDLTSANILDKMCFHDIQRLFLQTVINNGQHDVAVNLLKHKYGKDLWLARYEEKKLEDLHMPLLKPKEDEFRNGGVPQIMIKNYENLQFHDNPGLLLVHLLTLAGLTSNVEFLLDSLDLLKLMDLKDAILLFFLLISRTMYDTATRLYGILNRPKEMSIARYGQKKLTALHMLLMRKPSANYQRDDDDQRLRGQQREKLLKSLWMHVRLLDHSTILDLVTQPSMLVFDALESGNVYILKWLLRAYPELLTIKDPTTEQNLLHFVVSYRHRDMYHYIMSRSNYANIAVREVDKDGNNVLHFAASQRQEASTNLEPHIRMQRELEWYKEMEKNVPLELRAMRNNVEKKTPLDKFYANHEGLSEEVKGVARKAANSGMVVAGLIVTVTFAAALTTPGGDKNYDSAWFAAFILANTVSLFASCLSIIAFLSIFTSSKFTGSYFVISQHPNLNRGKLLLLLSVVTMVIAFVAASFLIFGHKHKYWIAYLVAVLGILTIIMLLQLILNISDTLLNYIISIHDYVFSKLRKMLARGTAVRLESSSSEDLPSDVHSLV